MGLGATQGRVFLHGVGFVIAEAAFVKMQQFPYSTREMERISMQSPSRAASKKSKRMMLS